MTGKKKCEWLKSVRARIARINGIEYHVDYECRHEGDCPGFCPACDKEAEELLLALAEKEQSGAPIEMDLDILAQLEAIAKEPITDDELVVYRGCVSSLPGIDEVSMGSIEPIDDSYMDWD